MSALTILLYDEFIFFLCCSFYPALPALVHASYELNFSYFPKIHFAFVSNSLFIAILNAIPHLSTRYLLSFSDIIPVHLFQLTYLFVLLTVSLTNLIFPFVSFILSIIIFIFVFEYLLLLFSDCSFDRVICTCPQTYADIKNFFIHFLAYFVPCDFYTT